MLSNLVVQVERAARAQARVDEKEERSAERLREQARLLSAYQARMAIEQERLALEREQAARLQQQQRSRLVRDRHKEEPATPCIPPATLRAQAATLRA